MLLLRANHFIYQLDRLESDYKVSKIDFPAPAGCRLFFKLAQHCPNNGHSWPAHTKNWLNGLSLHPDLGSGENRLKPY